MSKQQTSIRFSDETKRKLDWLIERHGTQTEAVTVAIHNLYLQEVMMGIKIGDKVRVKPFAFEQHLSKGATITPAKERQHNGYQEATVTALLADGGIEVETAGGYDVVPARAIEQLT